MLVSRITKCNEKWLQRFKELKDFLTINQEYPTIKTNSTLLKWIQTARSQRQIGLLNPNKIRLLERLPGWVWVKTQQDKDNIWLERLQTIQAFINKHFNGKIPSPVSEIKNFVEPKEYHWLIKQLLLYKKHKLHRTRANFLKQLL